LDALEEGGDFADDESEAADEAIDSAREPGHSPS
jgi:hypothetical protein